MKRYTEEEKYVARAIGKMKPKRVELGPRDADVIALMIQEDIARVAIKAVDRFRRRVR